MSGKSVKKVPSAKKNKRSEAPVAEEKKDVQKMNSKKPKKTLPIDTIDIYALEPNNRYRDTQMTGILFKVRKVFAKYQASLMDLDQICEATFLITEKHYNRWLKNMSPLEKKIVTICNFCTKSENKNGDPTIMTLSGTKIKFEKQEIKSEVQGFEIMSDAKHFEATMSEEHQTCFFKGFIRDIYTNQEKTFVKSNGCGVWMKLKLADELNNVVIVSSMNPAASKIWPGCRYLKKQDIDEDAINDHLHNDKMLFLIMYKINKKRDPVELDAVCFQVFETGHHEN
mmetsp:Transcript_14917/g.26794  ORF Transcript_14917/g.26794 Transcript_14917/m.26794 type:complete len:283 (-) Transcript_14917:331-1179(-)